MVAHKCDKLDTSQNTTTVQEEEVRKFVKKHGKHVCCYFYASAKENIYVTNIFEKIVQSFQRAKQNNSSRSTEKADESNS